MSNDETPLETVSLKDERTLALFTADGRVFYDLDNLIVNYATLILESVSGSHVTDEQRTYLAGAHDILKMLLNSLETLRAEFLLDSESDVMKFFTEEGN